MRVFAGGGTYLAITDPPGLRGATDTSCSPSFTSLGLNGSMIARFIDRRMEGDPRIRYVPDAGPRLGLH